MRGIIGLRKVTNQCHIADPAIVERLLARRKAHYDIRQARRAQAQA